MLTCFLDVEASSLLQQTSYPIEIGFVASDFTAGYVALIAPAPDWEDWDNEAESIHGLSRDAIERCGEPGGAVAAALNEMIGGVEICTDSPEIDERWLRRLFEAAGIHPEFSTIRDVDLLVLQAETAVRSNLTISQDLESIAQQVFVGADLYAHRALDDALLHAIQLSCVSLLHLSDDQLHAPVAALIERVVETKAKVIGGAVARHVRNGGNDGEALRQHLNRRSE